MTPRRFTSCAEAIGLELKHLDCLAVLSSCRLTIGVSILKGLQKRGERLGIIEGRVSEVVPQI